MQNTAVAQLFARAAEHAAWVKAERARSETAAPF